MTSKLSKKKKFLIWGGIILLVLLIIIAFTKKGGNAGIKVLTELPEKRTIIETVSANGKIQPEKDIKISPYISGEVVELFVKEGDKVSKGDLLAKIDPKIYQTYYEQTEAALQMQRANLANAKARLAQAQAQFVRAEEEFKRSRRLFDQQVISQSDFDAAVSAFEVARAEVTAAGETVKASEFSVSSSEASLREARENLIRTAIHAPSDGTVSRLSIEEGERVTGASQFSSGTEIMRIANLDRMIVQVEVNENDIVRVSLFDTCIIEVDAYLDQKFKGIVTEVATSANITGLSVEQVTNFEVKVLILEESYKQLAGSGGSGQTPFRPGMSATVDIQTNMAIDALTVPIQAVTTRVDTLQDEKTGEDGSATGRPDRELSEVVFVFDNGKARIQGVKTGIQDKMYIQVTEGIAEEDEVITGPYRAVSSRLKDGDAVRKVDKQELFSGD
jgi:HlyD family secretion protein